MIKLRTKYLLFVIILHGVALTLTYFIFRENRWLFLVSEVFIGFSLWVSWRLYRQLIAPLKMLMQGVEAIRDKDFNVKFLPTGKYEMDQLISVYNQMLDQLREERTLQEQQHFFLEKLIQTSPTGIIILDYDGNIQQTNPRAQWLLQNIPTLLNDVQALGSGESKSLSVNGVNTYKLQKSHFIDRGFPRHFVMVEELTAEILAAEKNVYGKVIRMMAHEVNNTIGPVNSIIASTLKMQPLDGQHRGALEVATERNQHLNRFMRNFADLVKLPPPDRKRIDLVALVRRVTGLMELQAAEKEIRFEFGFPAQPVWVSADAQQLEQAFINIIKNSMEAIGKGGHIRFGADGRELVITDSGCGIQDPSSLFSPFYSTKPDGQGIGLTLVREILLHHGWSFSLKTYGEKDTRFTIRYGQ
ncbi:sensor histidine kinase [Chitinophaga sp. GCM10012297]|uniref:histidine kinase n=1 Tax=Chitinophaga chungangae TaxID=2821488 RepID=A0ABS3YH91_9BACT|nr:ATP-binding protein [Chitinophaga chungangae]MBO9154042.1 HAMP domain-containing protein [Chitinophaga chungangae]